MLKISDLHVKLSEEEKVILSGINLDVSPGETHLIRGRNGSGKSTLAAAISGNPRYEIISVVDESYPGHILDKLGGKQKKEIVLNELSPDKRSLTGVFLANQYPLEIPGVNLSNFLRLAYNSRQEKELPVFKFRKLLKERAAAIHYPEELLDRNLNEGFSGGEKKKTEILQMAVLEPRYAILDETDSGLDPEAITEVFTGIHQLRETILPNLGLIVITHYDKVLDYLKPDFEHQMKSGKLVSID